MYDLSIRYEQALDPSAHTKIRTTCRDSLAIPFGMRTAPIAYHMVGQTWVLRSGFVHFSIDSENAFPVSLALRFQEGRARTPHEGGSLSCVAGMTHVA